MTHKPAARDDVPVYLTPERLAICDLAREFTAVDAVKHLLGAMQPATSEQTLVTEAERRLAEIFSAPITIHLDAAAPPDGRVAEVEASTPSGGRVTLDQ